MKIAIFTGPRQITTEDAQLIRAVVSEVIASGFAIYVGNALGVDAVVTAENYRRAEVNRQAEFRPHYPFIFYPITSLGNTPAGLAERSSRMMREALRAAGNDEIICIGFPNKPCPAGIVPAKSWRSGTSENSGTWSTLAMAVGNNIETTIFTLGEDRWDFPSWFNANVSIWQEVGGWKHTPAPSLFDIVPSTALNFDADDVSRYLFENERAQL